MSVGDVDEVSSGQRHPAVPHDHAVGHHPGAVGCALERADAVGAQPARYRMNGDAVLLGHPERLAGAGVHWEGLGVAEAVGAAQLGGRGDTGGVGGLLARARTDRRAGPTAGRAT